MVTVLKRTEKPARKTKAAAAQDPDMATSGPGDVPPNAPVSPPATAAAPIIADGADQWPFPTDVDPLDALVDAGPYRAAQLLLWKQRIQNPELSVQITAEDIKGFADCTKYLDIKPALLIWRRPGVEPQPGMPATGKRRAVAPTPGMPPAPFVTVRLVVQGTHDGFRPIENNETDYDAAAMAVKIRQLRQDIPQLANAVRGMIASGDYSTALLNEFVEGAVTLARAP